METGYIFKYRDLLVLRGGYADYNFDDLAHFYRILRNSLINYNLSSKTVFQVFRTLVNTHSSIYLHQVARDRYIYIGCYSYMKPYIFEIDSKFKKYKTYYELELGATVHYRLITEANNNGEGRAYILTNDSKLIDLGIDIDGNLYTNIEYHRCSIILDSNKCNYILRVEFSYSDDNLVVKNYTLSKRLNKTLINLLKK